MENIKKKIRQIDSFLLTSFLAWTFLNSKLYNYKTNISVSVIFGKNSSNSAKSDLTLKNN